MGSPAAVRLSWAQPTGKVTRKKAKGKRQKESPGQRPAFAFCLLPFAFRLCILTRFPHRLN